MRFASNGGRKVIQRNDVFVRTAAFEGPHQCTLLCGSHPASEIPAAKSLILCQVGKQTYSVLRRKVELLSFQEDG